MSHAVRELKFLATQEKGEVSALLLRPEDATHLLVLGHGASTNMRHATLQSIADRLAEVGIATFRYNFPYSENGKGRDGQAVCTATDPLGGRGGAEGRARPAPAGGRPFLRRPDDLDGGLGITDRGRGRPGLLLLPAPPGGQAGDEAGRPPRGCHGADALPERDARRAGGSGLAEAGLREAREPRDAPSPRHGRPRLQGPQEVPHERRRMSSPRWLESFGIGRRNWGEEGTPMDLLGP